MTVDQVLRRAEELGLNPKMNGRGFACFCPAHGDTKTRHLYVSAGDKVQVVFSCKKGCGFFDIAQGFGLEAKDTGSPAPTRRDGDLITHDYRDRMGRLQFQTCRRGSGGSKEIWQRRPGVEPGEWINDLRGVRPILYRLPELAAAEPGSLVLIGEGEKVAEVLAATGLPATTNPMGAKNWRDEFADELMGHPVAIFRDYDPDGEEWANAVAGSLKRRAIRSALVELPGLVVRAKHGEDAYDWVKSHGHQAAELRALAEAALTMGRRRSFTAAELMRMELAEKRWAVDGYISEGLNLFAGGQKIGKSWWTFHLAIAISSGGHALGVVPVEEGDVLYLALEDTPLRLQQRLRKLLQDEPAPERLTLFTEWSRLDMGGLSELREWLTAHRGARLVIIDTLARVRPPRSSQNPYEEDYAVMTSLKEIADEFQVAFLVVHHTRKMAAEDPFDLVSGTMGLTGAADATLVLVRSRGQNAGTLHITGRDVEERSLAAEWDPHTGLWAVVGTVEEARRSEERREIIDLVKNAAVPLTPKDVAQALGKNRSTTQNLMRAMLRRGEIALVTPGHYGPSTSSSSIDSIESVESLEAIDSVESIERWQ